VLISGKSSRTYFIAILAFAICSIAAAVRSRGFIESDGATHYVFARHAFEQPIFFVDIWGRPLCTALFAVPASVGGLIAVRMTSLLAAIGCALVAAEIARGQGYPRPVLALIFTLGQPLLFLHSFSELTELPFALVLGLAFIGYQRRRWWAMAILAGIAPLGRPEGFVFLLLAAVAGGASEMAAVADSPGGSRHMEHRGAPTHRSGGPAVVALADRSLAVRTGERIPPRADRLFPGNSSGGGGTIRVCNHVDRNVAELAFGVAGGGIEGTSKAR